MKKIVSLFLILFFTLLASCNIPASGASPTSNNIEESVKETLTAIPQATTLAPTQVSTTVVPTIQATATLTPTATLAVTETASPSPTIAPTLTATLSDDPKTSLGNPTYQNNLDNGTAFGIDAAGYQDDNTSISVTGGAMVIRSFSSIGYHGWRLTSRTPKNFYLEAIFITQSCGGDDEFGVVFRAPDFASGKGYYFGLRCSGEYNLFRWDESGLGDLMSWTSNPNILAGTGQTNRMGILANGTSIKLYINGKLLNEIGDSKFSEGHFGVYAAGHSGALTVNLDQISYWDLP